MPALSLATTRSAFSWSTPMHSDGSAAVLAALVLVSLPGGAGLAVGAIAVPEHRPEHGVLPLPRVFLPELR